MRNPPFLAHCILLIIILVLKKVSDRTDEQKSISFGLYYLMFSILKIGIILVNVKANWVILILLIC